jgi:uncharacterized protein YqeY
MSQVQILSSRLKQNINMEEDYLKDSRELIQNTFLEIIKVLDEYIPDEELKKETFKEMQDKFDGNLGAFFKK